MITLPMTELLNQEWILAVIISSKICARNKLMEIRLEFSNKFTSNLKRKYIKTLRPDRNRYFKAQN